MAFAAASKHLNEAIALRDRIIAGKTNRPLIQAWAEVARECQKADDQMGRYRKAMGDDFTRADFAFLNRLEAVRWVAMANIQTLRDKIAA